MGVKGIPALREVATSLKTTPQPVLKRELNKNLKAAAKPLQEDIAAHARDHLPDPYAAIIADRVRALASSRGGSSGAYVLIRVRAKGKSELRDLRRLNRGELRHPVWGRWRRLKSDRWVKNPWSVQKVKPGLVDEAVKRVTPVVIEGAVAAIETVRDTILKGSPAK